MTLWQFDSEFGLEEFLWKALEPLLNLKPLARQYSTGGQICDILATTDNQQLVVLELKNVEDRYVVPQLTRYYASLAKEKPFSGQVDYSQPIRLIAISPRFHAHNYVDQQHSRLDFEFWTFQVYKTNGFFKFELKSLEPELIRQAEVAPAFHDYLVQAHEEENQLGLSKVISRPPKSFRFLLDKLDLEQQEYLNSLRRKILEFDDRITEVGLTTRTQFGLKKGEKGIYQTKLCAELLYDRLFEKPILHLVLPYPKKEFRAPGNRFKKKYVRGDALAFVPLLPEHWQSKVSVGFFLGKSRQRPSGRYVYPVDYYSRLCKELIGCPVSLTSTEDLIGLALEEWRKRITN